ncbi:dynamin-related protein 4c [Phtheirospermum japonicum]|uniref:Dynamin-related protein 4c n=1 Tax=Phtheirospermum japonicum TaxID=374723 RepID=A0A830CZR5_9LAMI|nr:dynamin-related protein 4c [Phtheirospermum japonicum]
MVDLPGITRVPVHGQPEDIYEQISKIITEFITLEESIILNVLSASVDFTTCESIRMSQRVDKMGQRTLAVVTKADKSPEGLLEKVTADDVNIGLGYVCVRNRIGDESYEEARAEEARLFTTHPQLSTINKSIVGIPVLAERLVKIQAAIIVKCLPDIVRKINDKLSANLEELNKLPNHLTSVAEAMTTFLHILGSAKESLRKLLLQGKFDEYPDVSSDQKFLMDEIKVLVEAKSIGLPNFLSKTAFLTLLQRQVTAISVKPVDLVEKIWSYLEKAAQILIAKKKEKSVIWVNDMVEMEKLSDYTCNPEFKGVVEEAFDVKMRMTAYWEIVTRRMVDNVALHLLFCIRNLVNKEMQTEIINELVGPQKNGALERMLDESPLIAEKRNKLKKSIKVLKESRDLVTNIIDRVVTNFG